MAQRKGKSPQDPVPELLRDLLIVELAKAGVPQLEIRKVVGCDIRKVNRIAKLLKKSRGKESE